MNDIKRYEPDYEYYWDDNAEDFRPYGTMSECTNGDYVEWKDYQALLDEYNTLLEVTRPIRVSQEMFCKILDVMDNPPPPNEKLVEAMKKYSGYDKAAEEGEDYSGVYKKTKDGMVKIGELQLGGVSQEDLIK